MKFIFVLYMILFVMLVDAQAQKKQIVQTHTLDVSDGMMTNNAVVAFEDSRGLVWFGTDYGLHSYDGLDITVYTKEKHTALGGNYIHGIEEDQHGFIWIYASEQINANTDVSILDPKTKKIIKLKDYVGELPNNWKGIRLALFVKNADGTLWLTTKNSEIFEYDGEKLKFIATFRKPNTIDNKYSWLKVREGVIGYFDVLNQETGLEGMDIYDYNQAKYISQDTLENRNVYGVFFSVEKNMIRWVEVSINRVKASISNLKINKVKFYTKDRRLKKNAIVLRKEVKNVIPILPLLYKKQKQEQLIVKGEDGFLYYYGVNGKEIKRKNIHDTFNSLSTLLIDKNGGFWSNDHNQKKIVYSYYSQALFSSHQLDQNNGRHFFSGGRGMTLVNDSTLFLASVLSFEDIKTENNLSIKQIEGGAAGIMNDGNGRIYYVKYGAPLVVYNYLKSKKEEIYHFDKPKHSTIIWCIFKDPETKKIWLGANDGLYFLDTIFHKIIKVPSLKQTANLENAIIFEIQKHNNSLWLASSKGLYIWDEKKGVKEHYHKKGDSTSFLPHNIIADIHKDKKGNFWLASKGGGLIFFDYKTKKTKQFVTANGLSHNIIYAVYEDDYNQLWLSSNKGIMRFDKEKFTVINYTKESGLLDNEFNTVSHYKDKKGNIYFGSQKGLVIFHPKDFMIQNKKFPFLVSKVLVQDRETDAYQDIWGDFLKSNTFVLNPSDKGFLLKIALLDYRTPTKHEYSYQIKGINKDWQYQSSPVIKESNLPYGSYEIQLRIKGLSGIWEKYPKPIYLKVLRPFYLKWWFILGGIGSLLFSIYIFFRWRRQQWLHRQNQLERIVEERTQKIKKDKEIIEIQAKDLKALDKVKSRFFANISHELRTPLTLILGPLSYLLDKPSDWEKVEIKQQLIIMQRNGKSLMGLIEEILDLSKLEANKLELQEEATSLQQFFEYIYATFRPKMEIEELEFQLIFDLKEGDLTLLLDRKKVEKILNNFLANSIKFTPKNGKITILIKEEKGIIKITVVDTGKGVHPNDLPYIFERFYQSKQAEQKLYGGTGIGLALVREFASLMQGKVYASSILGEGSTFVFELPKKIVEKTKVIFQPLLNEPNQKLITTIGTDFTILVVEDNKDMRNFICQLLERKYKVLTAKNGAEGLEVLQKNSTAINLILSDVMMPEVDGLTMLKQIKLNKKWNGIPVIMLTALAAERDKLKALGIGVDDYLTKPFSVTELMVRVQNLLYNYHQREEWKAQQKLTINKPKEEEQVLTISEVDREWVNSLKDAISASLSTEVLTIEKIAILSHTGHRQLARRLKKTTGLSPLKFIKEVQLYHAREILEKGAFLSISEVAYSSGFENLSTFSKVFKKRFGKPPKEYLNKVKV